MLRVCDHLDISKNSCNLFYLDSLNNPYECPCPLGGETKCSCYCDATNRAYTEEVFIKNIFPSDTPFAPSDLFILYRMIINSPYSVLAIKDMIVDYKRYEALSMPLEDLPMFFTSYGDTILNLFIKWRLYIGK